MATRMTKRELEAELQALQDQLDFRDSRITELEHKVDILSARIMPGLTFKVSDRGAISIYGLQRFPITLYRNQWEKVLKHQEELKAFIKANEAKLKVKSN